MTMPTPGDVYRLVSEANQDQFAYYVVVDVETDPSGRHLPVVTLNLLFENNGNGSFWVQRWRPLASSLESSTSVKGFILTPVDVANNVANPGDVNNVHA